MKTLKDQLTAAKSELALRRSVYPKWLREGRITNANANHEIECFEAICKTLQKMLLLQEVSDEITRTPAV